MNNTTKAMLVVFIISIMFCIACVRVGEIKEKTVVTPLENAESAELNLKLGAGELKIQAGTIDALMSGYFKYNVPRWEPEVSYHKTGSKAYLTIEQRRSSGITLGRTRNRWDLQLNNRIPRAEAPPGRRRSRPQPERPPTKGYRNPHGGRQPDP